MPYLLLKCKKNVVAFFTQWVTAYHKCSFGSILWLLPNKNDNNDKRHQNQSDNQNHPPLLNQTSLYTFCDAHTQDNSKHN